MITFVITGLLFLGCSHSNPKQEAEAVSSKLDTAKQVSTMDSLSISTELGATLKIKESHRGLQSWSDSLRRVEIIRLQGSFQKEIENFLKHPTGMVYDRVIQGVPVTVYKNKEYSVSNATSISSRGVGFKDSITSKIIIVAENTDTGVFNIVIEGNDEFTYFVLRIDTEGFISVEEGIAVSEVDIMKVATSRLRNAVVYLH